MTVQFQVPILRHRFSLTSTKQHRKLRKISPRSDGRVWASVGNVLVDISEDLVETKRLEFPTEISDFVPAPDGSVYVALVFPQPVKILLPSEQACDFACPLVPPGAMALTDKHELAMAANDGKELSLTFYTHSGARSRRVSLPRPDFFPTSMTFTKRGQVFLCSSAEILCLDADFSEVACLCDDDSLQARAISTLRGVGSGVGDVLMANGSNGSVEVLELVGNTLERRRNLIEGRRGQDCDVTPPEGESHNISCCAVDRSGRLWLENTTLQDIEIGYVRGTW
ncbi:hypothetical protein C0Q70_07874 [Pomacea canaliculata]|uniref:SMP-30/Gluconolactonase/LRE-like region domain-containing protein n=1 Tax=Pomacea canaliculata TaxID=400727 RepID=A0A2T7PGF7_POMCA|nr:hypothetical protein C0Q70_07874 [Pomacea canaliculata]